MVLLSKSRTPPHAEPLLSPSQKSGTPSATPVSPSAAAAAGGLETWAGSRPINIRGCLDKTFAARFPLRTRGRHIIDKQGERFRLQGVNWYGASDVLHVVGGLDTQSLDVICQTVSDLGFNVVRLPYSNEMLRVGVPPAGSIDYEKNPRLRDMSALEVYDEVVRGLGRQKVTVIVNNHTTYGEFCGPPSRNSLWFDPYGEFTEEQWLLDWEMMARRYARCPHVVGFDLRNEIRPRQSHWPRWGGGPPDAELQGKCNWARAARAAADRISKVNPSALLVVERIVWPQRGLTDMAANPGPLLPALEGRLVLGVHMYHWSGPGRFVPRWSEPPQLSCVFTVLRAFGIIARKNYGDLSREELRQQVHTEFGSILEAGTCPVWVSEFGADLGNPEEMHWLQDFVSVLAEADADWAYWPLNVGNKPGTESNESYGMLGPDWRPKANGDYRLGLFKAIGLTPLPGVSVPPAGTMPLKVTASQAEVRSLLRSKDPLLAIKSTPDVRFALRAIAPRLAPKAPTGGMRRVHTANEALSPSVEARRLKHAGLKQVCSDTPIRMVSAIEEAEDMDSP